MACLELRRECKEENIEYCLELFFDEMKEASYQELYPEVFTSFADAFQGTETATAETSTTDPVKSPWEAFARPTKPFNERKMVNQKNFKDDKLSKLEKRFTDKPNLTGSPYKNRVLPNMGCVQGSTEILSLVSLNYTSFLNQLKFSLQKYPPSQEKFLLEFLLVIDSYQFIRNAFFILFEKFTRLSTKYSEFFTRRDDVFVEDESVLQKIRKKYLEMIGCIRIWGFLASLEAYNEDKFVWIEGESTKVIMPEAFKSAQFLFDQIFECKTWLEWAMLDAFLTFASPFLPLFTKQYLMSQIGYCQLKELYKSIKDKINLSISENRAQEDSQSAKDISKNDIYLLENSILEMIRKVHQLQVDSEGEEETDISEGVGALPTFQLSTRRTIKPVPVAFVPVI